MDTVITGVFELVSEVWINGFLSTEVISVESGAVFLALGGAFIVGLVLG